MRALVWSAILLSGLSVPRAGGAQVPVGGADPPDPLTVLNVVYGHQAGQALTFDVFKPERPMGAGVISIVSGGYGSGWVDPVEERIRYDPMLEAGFVVFSVRHGMSPRYRAPDMVDQIIRATRYIRLRAAEWGVDPDRLGLTGGSSGGHLALAVGLLGDDGDALSDDPVLRSASRVAAIVAFAPPSDLRPRWGLDSHPAFMFPREELERMSPILQVSSEDPPTLVVHGTEDGRVPIDESRRLVEALRNSGVQSRLVALEGAPHTFWMKVTYAVPLRATDEQIRQSNLERVRWFEQHLLRR
jgi:acetyl esterase/lipase